MAVAGVYKGILAVLIVGLQINLALALFNMLPIYPLDGSRIVMGLLPLNQAYRFSQYSKHGMAILMGIVLFEIVTNIPIFGYILWKPVTLIAQFFSGQDMHFLMLVFTRILLS